MIYFEIKSNVKGVLRLFTSWKSLKTFTSVVLSYVYVCVFVWEHPWECRCQRSSCGQITLDPELQVVMPSPPDMATVN